MLGSALAALLLPVLAAAQPAGTPLTRAGWLLERSEMDARGLHFADFQQTEVGGGGAERSYESGGTPQGVPILLSLLLPGAGEAYMGYRRGYVMMAADIAAWIGVKHYHDLGNEKRDEYIAFAQAHWSEAQLAGAFDPLYEDEYIAGVGQEYFPGVDTYTSLPLWVSREDDEREYFENLGKWDQFVFGWDDFTHPDDIAGYTPVGTLQDLKQPGVSRNRETYRSMRDDSNDQFTNRDRLLYFNIGLRVLSVLQVAYLQGMFGGGPRASLEVAGHPVHLVAEPAGFTGSRVGIAVAY